MKAPITIFTFRTQLKMYALLLFLSPSFGDAHNLGTFNGTWEGTLVVQIRTIPGRELGTEFGFRLEIEGDEVTVYLRKKNSWSRVPIGYQILKVETNALVYGGQSGTDEDGVVVESHTFLLTKKSRGSILAIWSRVVNNTDLARNFDHSEFGVGAVGELIRVK